MRGVRLALLLALSWPSAAPAEEPPESSPVRERIAAGVRARILKERGRMCLVRTGSERGWVRCAEVKRGGERARARRKARAKAAPAVPAGFAVGDLVAASVDFTARRRPRLDSLLAFDVRADAPLVVEGFDRRGRWARVADVDRQRGWLPVLLLTRSRPPDLGELEEPARGRGGREAWRRAEWREAGDAEEED